MSEKLNVLQRLAKVQKEVDYLQKKKQVDGAGGGYKAVTHDQVTGEVRPWFIAHGIAILPRVVEQTTVQTGRHTKAGSPIIRFEAVFDVSFINVDDPQDSVTARIPAHAEDQGDKAPGKAISYATKYAMLKVLMIETGENEESRVDGDGISADRIVEVEAWFERIDTIEALRAAATAVLEEAKAAGDSYAHKRFKEKAEKRAEVLGTELRQRPQAKASEAAKEPATEAAEKSASTEGTERAKEPAKEPANEPEARKPAKSVKPPAKAADASPAPSAGYLKHVQAKIKAAGKDAAGYDLSTVDSCAAALEALKG